MDDPLRLGDAELDGQHDLLDVLIRRLMAAEPAQRLDALAALHSHASDHFSAEDRSLVAMADGNAKCHLDEHAAVLKSLDEVRGVLVDESVAAPVKAQLVSRLGWQLLSWLPEHVQSMDAGVAAYRTREKFGGVPVVLRRASPR